jgi:hypothetical protein
VSEDGSSSAEPARRRREMGTILGLAVVAAGGLLLSSGRAWLRVSAVRPAPFAPVLAEVSGHNEFPALSGLAIVALIVAVLILVTAGWGRVVLGLMLALIGLSTAWYAAKGLSTPGPARLRELLGQRTGADSVVAGARLVRIWPLLSLVLSVVLAAAGIAVLARARHWQMGLSAKYDAPADAALSDDPWRVMDRGEDPTISDR